MYFRSDYNPFKSQRDNMTRVESDWQKLYDNFNKRELPSSSTSSSSASSSFEVSDSLSSGDSFMVSDIKENPQEHACIQISDKYIVTSTRDGLLVIDQHRAHVKILYEDYMARSSRQEIISQRVMFPETISLDSSQQTALDGISEELRKLGFCIEYDSESMWRITALPPMPPMTDAKDVILRILDSVAEDSVNYGVESDVHGSLRSRVMLLAARSAAIRGGQHLTEVEMRNIVDSLFALPDPSFTPNGNSVYTLLDDNRLSKLLD